MNQCTCVKDCEMTCIVHPTRYVETKRLIKEWYDLCQLGPGAPTFVPHDGICYSCRGDLVNEYRQSGRFSATGCTMCHRSYCD